LQYKGAAPGDFLSGKKKKKKRKRKRKKKMKIQKLQILPNQAQVSSKVATLLGFGDVDTLSDEERQEVRAYRLGSSNTFVNLLRVEADDADTGIIEKAIREGALFIVPQTFATPEDSAVVSFSESDLLKEHTSVVDASRRGSYHDHLAEVVPGVADYVAAQMEESRLDRASQALGVSRSMAELAGAFERGELTVEEFAAAVAAR
jgi:hypothetical protein